MKIFINVEVYSHNYQSYPELASLASPEPLHYLIGQEKNTSL